MAFRIKIGDLIIEADTLGELQAIINMLKFPKEVHMPAREQPPEEKIAEFIRKIRMRGGLMDKILDCLARKPEGMSDAELRAELGIKNNSALAGAMAGLSKAAVKHGLPFEKIIIKSKGIEGGYKYQLTQPVLDKLSHYVKNSRGVGRPLG